MFIFRKKNFLIQIFCDYRIIQIVLKYLMKHTSCHVIHMTLSKSSVIETE